MSNDNPPPARQFVGNVKTSDDGQRVDDKVLLLIRAAESGDVSRVGELIQCGVNPKHAHALDGWTPLHASSFLGHLQVTKMLLDHGALADSQDEHGRTPLQGACYYGHDDIARVLLRCGADPDARVLKTGMTALHGACYSGQVTCVDLLLKSGADPSSVNYFGETPLRIAQVEHNAGCIMLLQSSLTKQTDDSDKKASSTSPTEPSSSTQDEQERLRYTRRLTSSFSFSSLEVESQVSELSEEVDTMPSPARTEPDPQQQGHDNRLPPMDVVAVAFSPQCGARRTGTASVDLQPRAAAARVSLLNLLSGERNHDLTTSNDERPSNRQEEDERSRLERIKAVLEEAMRIIEEDEDDLFPL